MRVLEQQVGGINPWIMDLVVSCIIAIFRSYHLSPLSIFTSIRFSTCRITHPISDSSAKMFHKHFRKGAKWEKRRKKKEMVQE